LARLARQTQGNLADTGALRLRTAWLYHNRGWTQQAIAEHLSISRSTVIRMLDEARLRGEVQIWINDTPSDCTALALALEEALGLDEVIVVPGHGTAEETARDVGAALGRFLSDVIADNMVIGATWGRTLNASLQTFRPTPRAGAKVVSLLGGVLAAKSMNPVDFSWQLASRLNAECMLYLAPLIVDSAQTKQALIEKCGLQRLYDVAENLDLAIISCGDIGVGGSSLTMDFITKSERDALIAAGAMCDAGLNFLKQDGSDVDTPLRARVMNVGLETVARAGHVILAAGGAQRAAAIRAVILRTKCRTLITDEAAAKALMALQSQPSTPRE
jgi:DNA-binding transcriptional regulator LsrR (DeoR family)